ncbi:hypothetical protein FOZ60_008728 [Perkinsus olseni]|uniref:Alanine--glyoxylate aminotransferase 2 n=1 Tax=Perkinsus olseni TaxID=32597 RepID=A0A7J6PE94_PEROL|nr:hypothetical protein FOZ60_008728 [Perkinsus olseni]
MPPVSYNDSEDLLAERKRNFASSLSVSYANVKPLTMVRAKGQYINNVPHIGHCDERVVRAVSEMMATISPCKLSLAVELLDFGTNTRYLHPVRQQLAKELLSTFPAPLTKVFLVNSGSEANDLALRLARAYTKKTKTIAVERGYHGTTSLTISVSPYKLRKFKQGSSTPQPDWLSIIGCPSTPVAAAESLQMLRQEASKDEHGLCAFICESGMSVAGVVLPPDGFMREAYGVVHSHGGLCIADEVQVGLGRMGTHFWGFEQQGVVPDIATIGKPLGNGFPCVEYFSTFGGNTVSCAAALAVLRAIKEDSLQDHARDVGEVLKEELRRARRETPHIGAVRGSGLFVGVEIVETTSTERPPSLAPHIASQLVARLLLDHNMLTTLDGPGEGVLVIKPSMCFSEDNARTLVCGITQVLTAIDAEGGGRQYQSIPT